MQKRREGKRIDGGKKKNREPIKENEEYKKVNVQKIRREKTQAKTNKNIFYGPEGRKFAKFTICGQKICNYSLPVFFSTWIDRYRVDPIKRISPLQFTLYAISEY